MGKNHMPPCATQVGRGGRRSVHRMDHSSNRSSLHTARPLSRLATLTWSLLAISLLAVLLFVRQAEAAVVTAPAQTPVTGVVEVEESEDEEEAEGGEDEEESEDDEEDEGL